MLEHVYQYTESITGGHSPTAHFENPVNLHYYDCDEMIRTKRCKNCVSYNPMICEGDYCYYDFVPSENFVCWSTQESRGYLCRFNKKYIEADSIDSFLYNKPDCKVTNNFCSLHNSIVIWDSALIHKCPLELIDIIPMIRYADNLLVNQHNNILLHTSGETLKYNSVCNFMLRTEFEFEETTEGFIIYTVRIERGRTIGNDTNRILKDYIRQTFPASDRNLTDFNIKTKLTLAEIDEKELEKNILLSDMIFMDCERFLLSLTLMKNSYNKLFEIKTLNNEKMIIYSNYGTIWASKCIDVDSVNITNVTNNCYNNIQVEFSIYNRSVTGFLTSHDNIIRENSYIVDCNISTFASLKNGSIIERKNKKIDTIPTLEFATLNRALLIENNISEEFHHYENIKLEVFNPKGNNLVFEEGFKRIQNLMKLLIVL